jgi:phage repressor protein C with HTH and peptisase S24 domain
VRLGRIPLYGQAVGGTDGQFPLNGSLITEIAAPPSLAGVAGAYAVMVVGTSMEPRYFAGEAVFVNPRLPVRVGDFVVAQIAADEGEPPLAYVKRYVGQNEKAIRLEQLNPAKKLGFAADRVVSIHRIVMSGEG